MNNAKLLIDYVIDLVDANFWTGYWDNQRNDLCKSQVLDFSLTDFEYLYKTEKMSRSNVENRAVQRNNIESLFLKVFGNVK
jgi:hypothetical protein